jgi:REP element-mobilizing transposase RayT
LRIEAGEQLVFVTSRIHDCRFLLHPLLCSRLEPINRQARRAIEAKRDKLDARLARLVTRANLRRPPEQPPLSFADAKALAENLISSALARAQEACRKDGVDAPEVFAVLVMSNHIHLVARARGNNLARFVGYFKARVAMSINLLLGRTGGVWGRRYDAQVILDDQAALDRVRYTLQNPQKAKLVRQVDEWPGFVALAGRDDNSDMATTWFDWTAWHRARCPRDLSPFRRTSELILSKLPALEGHADRDYVREILGSLDALDERERVLGLDKVLDTDVESGLRRTKRSRRPYAFGDEAAVQAYRERCHTVAVVYSTCSERHRRGEHVSDWPAGTYPPGFSRAA